MAYEYTEAFDQNNMHRNEVFRNTNVTDSPVSVYDTGYDSFPSLWRQLRERCTDLDTGCDVMAIPHNSNLSGGRMFNDPKATEELENRLFFEPVVELVQHKGASECRYDRLRGIGLDTVDEQCDFEQIAADNLNMLGSVHEEVRTERANAVPVENFAPRNMVRNALKDGLVLEDKLGTNPFAQDCTARAAAATAIAHDNGASGDVFGKCCTDPATEAFYSPVIQERAWSSPIWYMSASGED